MDPKPLLVKPKCPLFQVATTAANVKSLDIIIVLNKGKTKNTAIEKCVEKEARTFHGLFSVINGYATGNHMWIKGKAG